MKPFVVMRPATASYSVVSRLGEGFGAGADDGEDGGVDLVEAFRLLMLAAIVASTLDMRRRLLSFELDGMVCAYSKCHVLGSVTLSCCDNELFQSQIKQSKFFRFFAASRILVTDDDIVV